MNGNKHANEVYQERQTIEVTATERDGRDSRLVRLDPKDFPDIPANLIKDLEKQRCLIPQVFGVNERHNVITGHFSKRGQKDWAILCSKDGITSVLIYWNGKEDNHSELFASEESSYMQDMVGDGTMGFSRAIDVVGKDYIISHYKEYGGSKPPLIEHDGINDAFVEKASTVHYLYNGKWLELQGAD